MLIRFIQPEEGGIPGSGAVGAIKLATRAVWMVFIGISILGFAFPFLLQAGVTAMKQKEVFKQLSSNT